jgi:hypothetical protein
LVWANIDLAGLGLTGFVFVGHTPDESRYLRADLIYDGSLGPP